MSCWKDSNRNSSDESIMSLFQFHGLGPGVESQIHQSIDCQRSKVHVERLLAFVNSPPSWMLKGHRVAIKNRSSHSHSTPFQVKESIDSSAVTVHITLKIPTTCPQQTKLGARCGNDYVGITGALGKSSPTIAGIKRFYTMFNLNI